MTQPGADHDTVKSFTTPCFIEFVANGELQSASSSLPLVLTTSPTLARTGNVAVTPPGSASVLSGHEDLIGKICELAGIGKREFLVPMKEFPGSLVILEVVMGIKACHELSDDVLAVMSELIHQQTLKAA